MTKPRIKILTLILSIIVLSSTLFSCGKNPDPPAPQPVINDIIKFDSLGESALTKLVIFHYSCQDTQYDAFRIEGDDKTLFTGYRSYINKDRLNFSLSILESEESELIYANVSNNGDLTIKFDNIIYSSQQGVWEAILYDDKTYSLNLNTSSVKKNYDINEKFSSEGLVVNLYTYGESVKQLDENEYTISGFDSSEAGYKYIDVCYGNIHAFYQIIVNGYRYNFYNDKEVYYIGEEFDKNQFELFYYDINGEHEITDYTVTIPKITTPQTSYFEISYNDFLLNQTIYVMNKPDIAPLKFETSSNNSLILYQSNIRTVKVNEVEHIYSDGYYLYQHDGKAKTYAMSFDLSKSSWSSSFSSSLPHRITSNGSLEVKVENDVFLSSASNWHLAIIGWDS